MSSSRSQHAEEPAGVRYLRFEAVHARFIAVTARAEGRFLARDWHGHRS